MKKILTKERIIYLTVLTVAIILFGFAMLKITTIKSKLNSIEKASKNLEEQAQGYRKELQKITKKEDDMKVDYAIEDEINLDKVNIIVHKIIKDYSSDLMKTVYESENGLALDVTIENKSSENISFTPIDFSVVNEDYKELVFYDVSMGAKQPELVLEELLPEERKRGYITFVKNAKEEKISAIYFKPNYDRNIKIDLIDQN